MDLTQNKLTKSEWQSIEIPVSEQEMKILRLIQMGFHDPEIKMNHNLSMLSFLKMTSTEDRNIDSIHVYLYTEFFADIIHRRSPAIAATVPNLKLKNIKKKDLIRINNMRQNIVQAKKEIFEFVLLDIAEGFFPPAVPKKVSHREQQQPPQPAVGHLKAATTLYTLIHLLKSSITEINPHVLAYIREQIEIHRKKTPVVPVIMNSPAIIEQNPLLIQYADLTLFPHQKQLFTTFNQEKNQPCLVLYTAPTGTGKTLSPIGLAQGGLRVIFVCSARHVGLSLAKSAISLGTRVAFAYGCNSAEDIRLHNFAAVDYTTNKRSGGIGKVDNSNGIRVEIMISDVKSYLIAMEYMLKFHLEETLVLYWDEPTITMDYDEHDLHPLIHRNWQENRISKIVLSCATLPKQDEIQPTLDDFLLRFVPDDDNATRPGGNIVSIVSHDCKKSITLLAANQFAVLPHLLFTDFRELIQSVEHCQANKTLLRYFDLAEIVRFFGVVPGAETKMQDYFPRIEDITMTSIKNFYLEVLSELDEATWPRLGRLLIETQRPKYASRLPPIQKTRSLDRPPPAAPTGGDPLTRTQSMAAAPTAAAAPAANPFAGILLTTEDAHTLTDGPTLYIAEDVEKIGKFLLSRTPIPTTEMSEIRDKISHNNSHQRKITVLEKQIEDELGKEVQKEKKMEREQFTGEVRKLKNELEIARANIVSVVMSSVLVPNTDDHQTRWCGGPATVPNAFRPSIQEEEVIRIMGLDVEDMYKVLLLLGIGTFVLSSPPAYLEIMKQMAQNQKLFLILASSDYIYGTNYQFCHSIIGKDLLKMTPQKTIQALGRVGRNNIQQEYTARFRNEEILRRLFLPMGRNPEAENMSRLWGGGGSAGATEMA